MTPSGLNRHRTFNLEYFWEKDGTDSPYVFISLPVSSGSGSLRGLLRVEHAGASNDAEEVVGPRTN